MTYLDFEKPIEELQEQIQKTRTLSGFFVSEADSGGALCGVYMADLQRLLGPALNMWWNWKRVSN